MTMPLLYLLHPPVVHYLEGPLVRQAPRAKSMEEFTHAWTS